MRRLDDILQALVEVVSNGSMQSTLWRWLWKEAGVPELVTQTVDGDAIHCVVMHQFSTVKVDEPCRQCGGGLVTKVSIMNLVENPNTNVVMRSQKCMEVHVVGIKEAKGQCEAPFTRCREKLMCCLFA